MLVVLALYTFTQRSMLRKQSSNSTIPSKIFPFRYFVADFELKGVGLMADPCLSKKRRNMNQVQVREVTAVEVMAVEVTKAVVTANIAAVHVLLLVLL